MTIRKVLAGLGSMLIALAAIAAGGSDAVAAPSDATTDSTALSAAALLNPDPNLDSSACLPEDTTTVTGSRIRHITVAQTRVSVLLPPQYGKSNRRYPVLYLLHGGTNNEDSFLVYTNLISVTSTLPDDEQYIVVTPFAQYGGFYVDWKDGSHLIESFITNSVIPAVDSTFRTQSDAAHRAVAGISMGGWGAMHLGVTHPDLFGAVGSMSGLLNSQDPDQQAVMLAVAQDQRACADGLSAGQYDPFGMLGDPVTDADRWAAANPVLNSSRLTGKDLWLSSSSGLPCDEEDIASGSTGSVEALPAHTTLEMYLALQKNGIASTYLLRACGLHTLRYFNLQLADYLPHVGAYFGSLPDSGPSH
ncbi:alpha/beta hydrolase [Kribbella speibonae]|uniref:Esterase family protein n=1 Tax=Kribbella speibonae TaxID=1572660 RepID=A0A4R0IV17_9ACTN|nr:alpha/beta hydrolase family protein [Kribbella speibonae]TCC36384.1 esterase family protein [Kribbella speibonae]